MLGSVPLIETMQAFDEAVLRLAHGSPAWALPVFITLTLVGAGWGLLLFVPFLVHEKTRLDAIAVLLTGALTNSVVNAFKMFFGRIRPCDSLGWCVPIAISSPGGWSFPSGHAAGSFAVATFVALRAYTWTKRTRLVAVVMFTYAALVAWSRCVLGVHYPTDVVAGSVLGIAIGWGTASLLVYAERAWGDPRTRLHRWRSRARGRLSRVRRPRGGSGRGDPGRDPASAAP